MARISAIAVLTVSLAACGQEGVGQSPPPTSTPQMPTSTPIPTPEPSNTPTTDLTPTATGEMVVGQATVESVEILILESFPVQVRAVVKGYNPDPCTKINEITQKRDGNTFVVTITTQRDRGQACIQVISPFEESISLDVAGLNAGTYTVTVNGVSEQFTLDVDNVLR